MVPKLHKQLLKEEWVLRQSLLKLAVGALALVVWSGAVALAQAPMTGQGRVISMTGNLTVKRSNLSITMLALNGTVETGEELATDGQSEAVIQATDGSTVHIYPDSRVLYAGHTFGAGEFLHLIFGSIKVHIEKLSGRPNPHDMSTPTAVIAVRGTTFSVFVDDTDATLVAVDEGLVAVANRRAPSDELLLRPGQRTWVRGNQPPLRAQAFRGRSEQADMIAGAMGGMPGNGMNGAAVGSAMGAASSGGRMAGTSGMSGRPGPPH